MIKDIENPSKVEISMVKNYMLLEDVYSRHIDYSCNVLNMTALAEDVADEYDIYIDEIDFETPEWVYEIAHEVNAYLVREGICQD